MHYQITDACSACFEQRTVFTQQVLAKALNQMVRGFSMLANNTGCTSILFCLIVKNFQVDQTPLPLLFMRTVIQAIDAFPALVSWFSIIGTHALLLLLIHFLSVEM